MIENITFVIYQANLRVICAVMQNIVKKNNNIFEVIRFQKFDHAFESF